MPRDYFPWKHSYLKKCEKLTDQELGRLLRALSPYSEFGERHELAGRESIAFDFIAADIDESKKAYDERCEKNRINGAKSAPANATDWERTVPNAPDCYRPPANAPQYKEENKEENKKNISPPTPPKGETGFDDTLQAAFELWMQYKRERREPYKPTGLKQLIAQIRKNAEKYGSGAVIETIEASMASNWKGIAFDKMGRSEGNGNNERSGPAARSSESPKRNWNIHYDVDGRGT